MKNAQCTEALKACLVSLLRPLFTGILRGLLMVATCTSNISKPLEWKYLQTAFQCPRISALIYDISTSLS